MEYSAEEIVADLKRYYNPVNIAGMARFGISSVNTLGVSMPVLRGMAKQIKKNHQLALELWKTDIHEARILAALIDDPRQVTEEQMEDWVKDFESWDVCDQCCMNLFDKVPFASSKALEWSGRSEEFIKRAGFVIMASMAMHDKKAADELFLSFFQDIIKGAEDERNFVRKAVNWAIRQIGKRSMFLNEKAIELAEVIARTYNSKTARWIASDAIRELKEPKIRKRIKY